MTNVMLWSKSLHSADFISMGAMNHMGTLIQLLLFSAIFTARLRVAPKPACASSLQFFHAASHWGLYRRDFFKMLHPAGFVPEGQSGQRTPLIQTPPVCTQFSIGDNSQFPGLSPGPTLSERARRRRAGEIFLDSNDKREIEELTSATVLVNDNNRKMHQDGRDLHLWHHTFKTLSVIMTPLGDKEQRYQSFGKMPTLNKGKIAEVEKGTDNLLPTNQIGHRGRARQVDDLGRMLQALVDEIHDPHLRLVHFGQAVDNDSDFGRLLRRSSACSHQCQRLCRHADDGIEQWMDSRGHVPFELLVHRTGHNTNANTVIDLLLKAPKGRLCSKLVLLTGKELLNLGARTPKEQRPTRRLLDTIP